MDDEKVIKEGKFRIYRTNNNQSYQSIEYQQHSVRAHGEIYALFLRENNKTGNRASRQSTPTKIIVERQYVGTENMESVFRKIAEEQIAKKVKEINENSTK